MSNSQIPHISIAGGPTIEFAFAGDVCTAELAGAKLRAERLDEEHADLRLPTRPARCSPASWSASCGTTRASPSR